MIESLNLELTSRRMGMLASYVAATILLIPANQLIIGFIFLAVSVFLVAADKEAKLRRRMGVLLTCVVILGLTDINTSLSNENFIKVGLPFTLFFLTWTVGAGRQPPWVPPVASVPSPTPCPQKSTQKSLS